ESRPRALRRRRLRAPLYRRKAQVCAAAPPESRRDRLPTTLVVAVPDALNIPVSLCGCNDPRVACSTACTSLPEFFHRVLRTIHARPQLWATGRGPSRKYSSSLAFRGYLKRSSQRLHAIFHVHHSETCRVVVITAETDAVIHDAKKQIGSFGLQVNINVSRTTVLNDIVQSFLCDPEETEGNFMVQLAWQITLVQINVHVGLLTELRTKCLQRRKKPEKIKVGGMESMRDGSYSF